MRLDVPKTVAGPSLGRPPYARPTASDPRPMTSYAVEAFMEGRIHASEWKPVRTQGSPEPDVQRDEAGRAYITLYRLILFPNEEGEFRHCDMLAIAENRFLDVAPVLRLVNS